MARLSHSPRLYKHFRAIMESTLARTDEDFKLSKEIGTFSPSLMKSNLFASDLIGKNDRRMKSAKPIVGSLGSIQRYFSLFNRSYFDGKLDDNAGIVLVSNDRMKNLYAGFAPSNKKIYINKDACGYMSKYEFLSTLLHEMSHAYVNVALKEYSGSHDDRTGDGESVHSGLFAWLLRRLEYYGWKEFDSVRGMASPFMNMYADSLPKFSAKDRRSKDIQGLMTDIGDKMLTLGDFIGRGRGLDENPDSGTDNVGVFTDMLFVSAIGCALGFGRTAVFNNGGFSSRASAVPSKMSVIWTSGLNSFYSVNTKDMSVNMRISSDYCRELLGKCKEVVSALAKDDVSRHQLKRLYSNGCFYGNSRSVAEFMKAMESADRLGGGIAAKSREAVSVLVKHLLVEEVGNEADGYDYFDNHSLRDERQYNFR